MSLADKPVIRVEIEKEVKRLKEFADWCEWKLKADEIFA